MILLEVGSQLGVSEDSQESVSQESVKSQSEVSQESVWSQSGVSLESVRTLMVTMFESTLQIWLSAIRLLTDF